MKYLLFVTGLFFFLPVLSQEYKNCTYTYFNKSKKTSSSHCYNDKYEGKAIAYNQKGEKIGEWDLSRMHMLSNVHFTFHENGAVAKAEYSSHPDAGIQWYKSYTTYDENGVQTEFTELSDDMHGTVKIEPSTVKTKEEYLIEQKLKAEKSKREADSLQPIADKNNNTEKKDTTFKQEVIECAVIYVSELWVENKTRKDITLKWEKKFKGNEKENSLSFQKLKKGEKIKITEQIQAQFYESPISIVSITIWNAKGKKKLPLNLSDKPLTDESRLNENRKAFIYDIK
jgi:hypothetical protein